MTAWVSRTRMFMPTLAPTPTPSPTATPPRTLKSQALSVAETIVEDRPPEVQVVHYGLHGISYRVKYGVPQHDREPVCRNEVFSLIDAALRARGIALAQPQTAHLCEEQETRREEIG